MFILGLIVLLVGALVLGSRLVAGIGILLMVLGLVADVSAGVWHVGTTLF